MSICPICKTKLIPIVHRIDPDVLDMQNQGLLLIGMDKNLNSFCPLCEEPYGNYTDMPVLDTP